MGSKANIGSAINSFRQSVRPVMDTYSQAMLKHKLDDLERKQRLADELAQKRQTGIDEGSYIPAPRVQVGTTTDKLSLLPGMVDPTKTMPSYASTIQPQSTFRLGGEGYMPKPVRTKYEASTLAEQQAETTFKTNEDIRKENAKIKEKPESPSLTIRKEKATTTLIDTVSKNNEFIDRINEAKKSAEKIPYGAIGKGKRWIKEMMGSNDPMLAEWQKVKGILTDIQLGRIQFTKGAISDREMELFAAAAANDDISSLPKIIVALNEAEKKTKMSNQSAMQSYKRSYGEDPSQWEEFQGVGVSNIPIQNELLGRNKLQADQFKIGQTMQKNGITYKYSGNGQWSY